MTTYPKLLVRFEASNEKRGYRNKTFEFVSSSGEFGVWRLIRKFKASGNYFHSIMIFSYASEIYEIHKIKEYCRYLADEYVNEINTFSTLDEWLRYQDLTQFID